jgi:hypothetical protein
MSLSMFDGREELTIPGRYAGNRDKQRSVMSSGGRRRCREAALRDNICANESATSVGWQGLLRTGAEEAFEMRL